VWKRQTQCCNLKPFAAVSRKIDIREKLHATVPRVVQIRPSTGCHEEPAASRELLAMVSTEGLAPNPTAPALLPEHPIHVSEKPILFSLQASLFRISSDSGVAGSPVLWQLGTRLRLLRGAVAWTMSSTSPHSGGTHWDVGLPLIARCFVPYVRVEDVYIFIQHSMRVLTTHCTFKSQASKSQQ
jgi:hypothetical protein